MSKVAVLRTKPETVLEDVGKVMRMADYAQELPKDKEIALKINISWHHWYPACSTTPWQLEGVIKVLLEEGFQKQGIIPVENKTVVTNP